MKTGSVRGAELRAVLQGDYWRAESAELIVTAWEQSGETLTAFARRHGVRRDRWPVGGTDCGRLGAPPACVSTRSWYGRPRWTGSPGPYRWSPMAAADWNWFCAAGVGSWSGAGSTANKKTERPASPKTPPQPIPGRR